MAMYFMGSTYDGVDMTEAFRNAGGAFIGYDEKDAQPLYQLLNEIQMGDFVVLKGYSPSHGLFIKSIGVCISNKRIYYQGLNSGREVQWLWHGNENFGRYQDLFTNMRTGTIYIEKNEDILRKVLDLALK